MILGILAAVVVVNVVGLTGRGEAESYATDERTIQLAVSTFFADVHAYSSTDGWNEEAGTSVHNYPTATGTASKLYLGNETGMGKYKVNMVMDGTDNTPANEEIDHDITAAAIWMGLLVNGAGQCDVIGAGPDVAPGDNNSPRAGEHGPYLNPLPRSCSKYNSSTGTGTITWIVGAYSRIYGVFSSDENSDGIEEWYAGSGGRYP
jgi:type II secretory pathway pseudopilin PulG